MAERITGRKRALSKTAAAREARLRYDEQFRHHVDKRRRVENPDGSQGPRQARFQMQRVKGNHVQAMQKRLAAEARRQSEKPWKDYRQGRTWMYEDREQGEEGMQCTCSHEDVPDAQRSRCQCSILLGIGELWTSHGLACSTIAEYYGRIDSSRKDDGENWTARERALIKELIKEYKRLAALQFKPDGKPVGTAEGTETLEILQQKDEDQLCTACYLQAATGPREDCLAGVLTDHVVIKNPGPPEAVGPNEEIHLAITSGKGIKETKDHYTAYSKLSDCLLPTPKSYLKWRNWVLACKRAGGPGRLVFPGLCTNESNDVLRRLERDPYTKAWRKHFAARVFAETGDRQEVSRRLGHKNAQEMHSFYLNIQSEAVVDEYREFLAAQGREHH